MSVIPFPLVAGAVAQQMGAEAVDRLAPPTPPLVFRSQTTVLNPWWLVLGALLVYVVVRGKRR